LTKPIIAKRLMVFVRKKFAQQPTKYLSALKHYSAQPMVTVDTAALPVPEKHQHQPVKINIGAMQLAMELVLNKTVKFQVIALISINIALMISNVKHNYVPLTQTVDH
jgi:hypothetical protein